LPLGIAKRVSAGEGVSETEGSVIILVGWVKPTVPAAVSAHAVGFAALYPPYGFITTRRSDGVAVSHGRVSQGE
jgi:hypothetical protein